MRWTSLLALSVLVPAIALAQDARKPDQDGKGGLAKDEAAALLEQRKKAAATLNADDQLLRQSLDVKLRAKDIVTDPVFSKEHAEKAAATYTATAEQIRDAVPDDMDKIISELTNKDPLVSRQLEAARKSGGPMDAPIRYRLYVSQSMGPGAMRAAFVYGAMNPDMVLVFKGLKRGQKFTAIMKLVTELYTEAKEGKAIPRIMIDPTLFADSNVQVVPTLEVLDKKDNAIAIVRGNPNPRWIEDQVAAGRKGDLGNMGATSPIVEIDMATLLQEAAAKIDLKKYGQTQVANFWKYRDFYDLPTATVSKTRKVDPTVVMTETISAPDGTVLAYPGQRLNPFDVAPFNMKLVVIDARDDAQVAFARRQVIASEGKSIRVIATRFSDEPNFKEYDALIGDVGRHVYLLEKFLAERLGIEKVPCTVEGGDRVLIVKEYAIDEIRQGEAHAGSMPSAK